MTTWSNPIDRDWLESDALQELGRFEKIPRQRDGVWGVGADTPRLRARHKSRGGTAARRKARQFNGISRRSRFRHVAPAF